MAAIEKLEQEAIQGNPEAVFELFGIAGNYLSGEDDNGNRFEQNHAKAFQIYKKLASIGFPPAVVFLGNCYDAGIGTEKNSNEAVKCWLKALDLGMEDPRVYFRLGLVFLGKAADLGHDDARTLVNSL